jgi:cytochrome c-type biogenesis protein CcmH/NrfG
MTTLFVVLVALIVAAAAGFAVWPVLRGAGRGRLVLAAAMLLFVAGIGAGSYLTLGRPALAVRTLEGTDTRDTAGLIALLVKRVHQEPRDLRAWTYLGKAYLTLGDSNDAAKAFARAIALNGANAELYSAYGEALVVGSGGAVPPEAEAAFNRALALAPKDQAARYYLGFAYAARGDKAKAIGLWQSLIDEAPRGAAFRQELEMRIAALSRAPNK